MKEPLVVENSEKLTKEQQHHLSNAAVEAYLAVAEVSDALFDKGIHIIQGTIAVRIPGVTNPRVVNFARPRMPKEVLKELLESLGRESDAAVAQAEIVEIMAMLKLQGDQEEKCAKCSEKDTCEEREPDVTIQ